MRRLGMATAAIVLLVSMASLGYWGLGQLHHSGVLEPRLEEPWSVIDCLYMTVVTISTIGYTETLPVGAEQSLADFTEVRVYTMGVILLALLQVGYAVSSATAFLVEGDLMEFWHRRRALKDASRMRGHYIVCGGGVTGRVILRELAETHHDAVVIELDEGRADEVRERFEVPVLVGDATSDAMLEAAGIERAAGLAAALPNDRDNVFLIITARRHRASGLRIVSLASSEEVQDKLVAAGADGVVAASYIGGLRLASELFRPAVTSFLDIMLRGKDDAVRFAQIELGARWDGQTVGALQLLEKSGLPVLALQQPGAAGFEFNPPADTPLRTGTVIVTMGSAAKMDAARARLA
ncbi:MAG TPA: NAD-binding protein [Polyangiaceae bacterium LLY-WYZ-15_(1-7)]|nr:hypothetical protein [Myxococcales bacterium]MAT26830.1 hypothetical protein [Sandaracinus sp.]HJK99858.1 NAD-binding protein [Polyangiaceae bacterium LLY-WYZ-15_(1-7)]MBJ73319.1 hypothetical protein [Sandaracinus sp.]HJL11384.1 NAD-binding protein [Polyangiaceae bacterium LLY-WYZ-15_(1-7)]